MNKHAYLRAYMAGIVVPTVFLLMIMTFFFVGRYVYNIPIPVERVIVFPMALVPNLWGVWNLLYILMHSRRLPIGLYGAALPFLLAPLGFALTRALDFKIPAYAASAFPIAFPVAIVVYYLAWKYLVGFFNEMLGIA